MLIGELLIKSGIITENQLKEALEIQKKKQKKLGEILVELGYLNPRDLLWLLSEQKSIPFIELKPEILNSKLIFSFPEELLYKYLIIPLYEIENTLYIATGNPAETEGVAKIKEFAKKEVVVAAAEPDKITQLLDKFFLMEQTEGILRGEDFTGTVNIIIAEDGAVIKFVDANGTEKSYRVKGDIVIKYINPKKR